jgi:hypothetical protein
MSARPGECYPMDRLITAAGFLPTFDSDFFVRMLDDIAHNRFSPEGMFLVLAFFGLFGAAVGILLSIKPKIKRTVDAATSNWIIHRTAINDLLHTAVSQRSKVRLSFHRDDKRSRSTDAVFEDISEQGFVLELSTVRKLNRAWIGKLIDCDFRVKEKKSDVFNFYHFVAEILDIRMGGDEILRLHAAFPLRIEASQKRSNLRIDPPDRLIPVFRVWRAAAVTSGKATELDYESWGEPHFDLVPGRLENQGEIIDLSGGGMGLETVIHVLDDGPHRLAVSDDLYIRVHLVEPDEDMPMMVFILARVLVIREEAKVEGRHRLGLRFVRQGKETDPKLTRLRWQTVDEEGIREVDDWVFNRHLELYRQRGM